MEVFVEAAYHPAAPFHRPPLHLEEEVFPAGHLEMGAHHHLLDPCLAGHVAAWLALLVRVPVASVVLGSGSS